MSAAKFESILKQLVSAIKNGKIHKKVALTYEKNVYISASACGGGTSGITAEI